MLADLVSHVIGIDPDRDGLTAAVVDAKTTGVVAVKAFATTPSGYAELLAFVEEHTDAGERAFAVEGSGSYGAGATRWLQQHDEWVIDFDHPTSRPSKDGAKTDGLDAIRAARETLGRVQLNQPRARHEREAIRVRHVVREAAVRARTAAINELKALLVTAPDHVRDPLRGLDTNTLVRRCAALRGSDNVEVHHTKLALRALAQRIRHLDDEVTAHERALQPLLATHATALLAEPGVGPISAAQLLISWSHPGRCRHEAAFARLAGVAPIPASSGQTHRHRLNHGGDRQLNRALHTVAISRMRYCPDTRAYIERRISEGKTRAEARRCLKRYLARHFYRLLEHPPTP